MVRLARISGVEMADFDSARRLSVWTGPRLRRRQRNRSRPPDTRVAFATKSFAPATLSVITGARSSCPQNDTLCRGNRCAVCHDSSEEVGEARRSSHVGSHVSTANAATRQTLEVLRAGKSSLSYPSVCVDRHCIGCRPDRSKHLVATCGRVPLPSDLRSRRIPSAAIPGGVAARQQRVHGRGTRARDGQDVKNHLRSPHRRTFSNPRRNADGHNARSTAITGW